MDDRTWKVVLCALALSAIALTFDVFSDSFEISPGFWGFLSAVLGFLAARTGLSQRNGNGRRNGQADGRQRQN